MPIQKTINASRLLLALLCFSLIFGAHSEADCRADKYGPKPEMIWLEGGQFTFGSDKHYPEEARAKKASVKGFWISKYEITNSQFKAFVEATGYKTLAERRLSETLYPDIPDSQRDPGSVVFTAPNITKLRPLNHWRFIKGANWRHPEGPNSTIDGRMHHPVVHIAYQDALAYADWSDQQLPNEMQWEYAAQLLTAEKTDAEHTIEDAEQPQAANTWQGLFPVKNLATDGFTGTAPVGCFSANAAGIHDMIGNVWEWTRSIYLPSHDYPHRSEEIMKHGFDPRQPEAAVNALKGGSYLCAPNFCRRYRPTARHAQDITLGSSHIGFRTIKESK